MVIMNLLYAMAPTIALVLIPAALHFYFDIFAGVLQTYIFCVLSLTFVGIAAEG
jgi:F-type H+-transporting ATPase subunit a